MIARRTVLAALTGSLPGCAGAQRLAPEGFQQVSISRPEGTRRALVQPGPRGAPLILLLHGGLGSMQAVVGARYGGTAAWPGLARREGAILLVPNGTDARTGAGDGERLNWNDFRDRGDRSVRADDVGFLSALLDWSERTLGHDPLRVLVTGVSNGGMMSMRLIMEAPGRVAAGACFIGSLAEGEAPRRLPRPTPLLVVNGTADPLVQWQGGAVAGNRGVTMAIPAMRAWWVQANGAQPAGVDSVLGQNATCRVVATDHAAGPGGAPLRFVTMEGGGHSQPSAAWPVPQGPFWRRLIGPACAVGEGADMAWEFFRRTVA